MACARDGSPHAPPARIGPLWPLEFGAGATAGRRKLLHTSVLQRLVAGREAIIEDTVQGFPNKKLDMAVGP
jgi:hypothetical protein